MPDSSRDQNSTQMALEPKKIPFTFKTFLERVTVNIISSANIIANPPPFESSVLVFLEWASQNSPTDSAPLWHAGAQIAGSNRLFVGKHLTARNWKAAEGCSELITIDGPVDAIGVIGLGSRDNMNPWRALTGGQVAGKFASKSGLSQAFIWVPELYSEAEVEGFMSGVVEGLQQSPKTKYSSDPDGQNVNGTNLKGLTFVTKTNNEETFQCLARAIATAHGTQVCAELVTAPSNYCNIPNLAAFAKTLANEHDLEFKELTQEELVKEKMAAYLAVNKGAYHAPRLIHLTYRAKQKTNSDTKEKTKTIAFVGKGLVFDSGGYNIKSAASGIETMKLDMGGCAALLGAAIAVAKQKPPNVNIHFISALAENMVDAYAYRPGDVLTASNGKTIEIGNTDAEGRLTLADALVYAEKTLKPDLIVDVATLTGAAVVALGPLYAALFASSKKLQTQALDVAENAGELVWPLPLPPQYREFFKSKIADINNAGGRYGGAIVAALFLKEFVEKAPWIHLDIAGPAYKSEEGRGTGFGVRLLTKIASSSLH